MEGSNKVSLLVLFALATGVLLGYWYGLSVGYSQAELNTKVAKAVNDSLIKKATEQVTKKANPFQAVNPLEGVKINLFDKTKKALNPFQ